MCVFYEKLSKSCDSLKEVIIPKLELMIKEKRDSKKSLIDEKAKFEQNLKNLKDITDKIKNEYNAGYKKVTQYKNSYIEARKFLINKKM
jgi:hypothetical protein